MSALKETRFAYGDALVELGKVRPEVVALDADLYKSTRTVAFRDAFPDHFFDVGISEADMVSTAAGMAASGLIPYCNSFSMFITGVCYMPIRTQIAYPSLPVKLIGSSCGLTQGPDGASHQSLEDIALMRVLPNMIVVSPADDIETRKATFALADWPGPAYMRVGRYPTPSLFGADYQFVVGKATWMRAGSEVVIFATGHTVAKALAAAEDLAQDGVEAGVVNVSTIKPLDEAIVKEAAAQATLVVTVEEHSIIGGLGGAVAECLAETRPAAPLVRLGVRDCFGESGLADELLEKHGLQPRGIREAVIQSLTLWS
jgi:transketolase